MIRKPIIICLNGRLGVGKTTFAKGFIKSYGYKGLIKSPTFSIVNEYNEFILPILHFDFYRIKNINEIKSAGINDYLEKKAILLIEWGEKIKLNNFKPDIIINFIQKKKNRELFLYANTKNGKHIIINLN